MGSTGPRLMKGPKPTKTGINAKIDYIQNQVAGHGFTREQAVQKLLKKFPNTSASYAKSIVYSKCAGLDFVPVRKRGPAPVPVAKEVPKKVTRHPSTKRKKARAESPSDASPDSNNPVIFEP